MRRMLSHQLFLKEIFYPEQTLSPGHHNKEKYRLIIQGMMKTKTLLRGT
jgi:hypothetical protein